MSIKKPFDIKKEFPNYFQEISKRLLEKGCHHDKQALFVLEGLLSANFQAILKRLNLVYIDVNGQPATTHFFYMLEEKMRACLPKGAKKDDLEIYISGGVVRTLLAYIYKELHTSMQTSAKHPASTTATQKAREIHKKSSYLELRNQILSYGEKNPGKPFDIEACCKAHPGANHIILSLSDYLKNNTTKIDYQDINAETDNGLYQAYLSVADTQDYADHSALWQAMDAAEYHLLRSYMIEQTPLSQAFVLGVGSDLDILYELKGNLSNDNALNTKLCKVATTFINGAQTHFKLKDTQASLQQSLIPIGDVNDYQKQISRVLQQGGSMLDALAFKLSDKKTGPVSSKHHLFREPIGADKKKVPIIKSFIDGICDYINKGQSTQKQTIRGLRALLELPFLELSEQGKAVIISELRAISEHVRYGTLDPDAMKQVEKMVRNAHFSGAHNRGYRESKDTPLGLFVDIVNRITPTEASKIRVAFPRFLETFDNRTLTGRYQRDVSNALMDIQDFINTKTANGVLYHGTSMENVLPILRGGFIISDKKQGAAVYGSGVYTTPIKEIAQSYAKEDGQILELKINSSKPLSILDVQKLSPIVLAQLTEEADSHDCDLNELLSEKYGVDIVINEHVILQNLDAIWLPKNFAPIVNSMALLLDTAFSRDQIAWSEIEKYESFYHLAAFCGTPLKGIRTPDEVFASLCNTAQVNMRDNLGCTLLMNMVQANKPNWVAYLLKHKKNDLASTDRFNKTALNYAFNNTELFRLLLSYYPDEQRYTALIDSLFKENRTIQHLNDILPTHMSFHETITRMAPYLYDLFQGSENAWDKVNTYQSYYHLAKTRDVSLEGIPTPDDMFRALCMSHQVNLVDEKGRTLLMKVVGEKQSTWINYLLTNTTYDLARKDINHCSVLSYALYNSELFQLLLSHYADEQRLNAVVELIFNEHMMITHLNQLLPLNIQFSEILQLMSAHLETLFKHSRVVEWKKFDTYEAYYHFAQSHGFDLKGVHTPDDVFKSLCRSPQVDMRDDKNRTLLMYITIKPVELVRLNHVLTRLSIKQQLAILNEMDNDGRTILHLVINNPDLFKTILSMYPDEMTRLSALKKKDNDGKTPLSALMMSPDDLKSILMLIPLENRLEIIMEGMVKNTRLNAQVISSMFELLPQKQWYAFLMTTIENEYVILNYISFASESVVTALLSFSAEQLMDVLMKPNIHYKGMIFELIGISILEKLIENLPESQRAPIIITLLSQLQRDLNNDAVLYRLLPADQRFGMLIKLLIEYVPPLTTGSLSSFLKRLSEVDPFVDMATFANDDQRCLFEELKYGVQSNAYDHFLSYLPLDSHFDLNVRKQLLLSYLSISETYYNIKAAGYDDDIQVIKKEMTTLESLFKGETLSDSQKNEIMGKIILDQPQEANLDPGRSGMGPCL